jgi:biotin---protein ligase
MAAGLKSGPHFYSCRPYKRSTWSSLRAEFLLTFYFHVRCCLAGTQVPYTQYVVCLAVISALQHVMACMGLPTDKTAFPFRIKWPNDIYVISKEGGAPQKVGGILCNSLATGQMFSVVIGMGLNVSNEEPTTCVNSILRRMVSDSAENVVMNRERLLATIINHFEEFQQVRLLHQHEGCVHAIAFQLGSTSYPIIIQVLETEGFDVLEPTYRRYWLHENQRVFVGEAQTPMTVRGLSRTGYLRATDDAGEYFELHPDGNSFDMMQGMISRRVLSP